MSEIREGNIILTYETRRAEEYIRTVQASAKATRELEDAIEDAQKDAGNIGGAADKVRPGLAKFSNSLQSVRKTALGVFAGNLITAGVQAIGRGLGGLVSGAAASAIAFEQTKVSFETFLGSAEAAEQVLSDLNEFSLSTPFEPTQVQEAGKALLAFGVEQEKLIPTLRAVGDISAGTGKDFNELAVIFGKARVQGTLFAEDINQLTEAGVPVIQKFAKQLGVTEGEVKKLASEGAISFENLEEAFISLTSEGGKFFELTARQSQTDGGLISTLRGVGNEVLKSIGQAFLPFLREGVVL
ncbi:MAG: tape measure protein, partial [Bacteroidota bacterium]